MTMRALVTRPRAEAEALAALLAARGIEAVIEPMLEITDREGAMPNLAGVQAILCTSANGVRALARVSDERGLPIFAVGDASASAAHEAGFHRVESAGGDVGDLARLVRDRLQPQAGTLLHVAGSNVAGNLGAELGGAGFTVERAVLYKARPASGLTPTTAELIGTGKIDLAMFFSPRTAAVFVWCVRASRAARGLAATTAISISPAADQKLQSLPFRARQVAAAPTQSALLAVVDQFIGQLAGQPA
jgi:uroporphyrinogen-III synthase